MQQHVPQAVRPVEGKRRKIGRGISTINNGADYTKEEIEFMMAVDTFKQRRPFPTWEEVLGVFERLGYQSIVRGTRILGVRVKEFTRAMKVFQKRVKSFPTWQEVFQVLTNLGYRKPTPSLS